jgi:hypothetical protein
MRAVVATALLLMTFTQSAADENRPVPKDRTKLTGGEWFPYVLSKMAPLEWSSYRESPSDLKGTHYSVDQFPNFCFFLFRPSTESYFALVRAVSEYDGAVVWRVIGNCIAALPAKPTFYAPILTEEDGKRLEEAIKNPPKPDPTFVKRAVADIPGLCSYLEKRLHLTDVVPKDFDPGLLTREGLAQSRDEYADFYEPGDQPVFLVSDPKTFRSFAGRQRLGMGVTMRQVGQIFNELKASSEDDVLPDFPFLSRLSDITNSAVYEPTEIPSFQSELLRAQRVAKEHASLRGLDNLIRITRLAQKQSLAIYFAGQ